MLSNFDENPRKNPHKIPKNYFENFEDELFSKIKTQDFPEDTGFVVPKYYFENFSEKLNEQLSVEKPIVRPLYNYRILTAGIAAVFIFGLFLLNFNKKLEIEDTSITAIDEYVDNGNLKINLFDLGYLIEDDEINWVEFSSSILKDSIIENYLIEESSEHFWNTAYVGE